METASQLAPKKNWTLLFYKWHSVVLQTEGLRLVRLRKSVFVPRARNHRRKTPVKSMVPRVIRNGRITNGQWKARKL